MKSKHNRPGSPGNHKGNRDFDRDEVYAGSHKNNKNYKPEKHTRKRKREDFFEDDE